MFLHRFLITIYISHTPCIFKVLASNYDLYGFLIFSENSFKFKHLSFPCKQNKKPLKGFLKNFTVIYPQELQLSQPPP